MGSLILLSVVLVSLAIPIYRSTRGSPRRSLRRAQQLVLLYIVVWTFLCTWYYPQIVLLR